MKSAVLQTLAGLPVAGAIALAACPAHAQFYSVPLSNGSFNLVPNATGTANQISGPINLLSPIGTILVTGNPSALFFQPGITVTTETPLAVSMQGIVGSVNLADGRTANFGPIDSGVGVETLATVTGAPSWLPNSVLPIGANVAFAVRNGYLSFPEANLSGYTTNQISIPVTNGTPFTVNVPVGAGPETLTIDGALSPIGTVNLAVSYPVLVNPTSTFWIPIGTTNTDIRLGGVVSGTYTLPDGRIATLNNLPFSVTATARVVTEGVGEYIQPDVYNVPITIQGTLTGGTISVPASAIAPLPQPPITNNPPPITNNPPPITNNPPTGNSGQPTPETPSTVQSNPVGSRPVPVLEANQNSAIVELSFTQGLDLGGEISEFVNERLEVTTLEIPDVDRSSLEFSRIHPGVNMYN